LDEVDYRRARHIVTENQRVVETVNTLKSAGARAIGELLNGSHASMRDDFEISCAELDCAVEASLEAGAIGARMTGGGFGGTAIAFISSDSVDAVIDAVGRAFSDGGFAAPRCFVASPADGAHRESP
ncbi:MAG: galactokinase, partial [Actinomycetota bacterium]